ncbi:FAD-dependent oxidoreductase [Ancylobacter terrae]|uniref:FAD-dependent oxidoreductase n=1 Tax=Ancylobacter sp. sgz301288 TaxID=3342077 RepID=UPI00385A4E9B
MKETGGPRHELAFRLYPYERVPEQDAAEPARWPVVVVGAGPVGLAAALDLASQGVPVLLLDDQEGAGTGSRAICFAKRTLEICDRLGAADPIVEKGVVWNVGKVFRHDRLVYEFDLLPEPGHRFPAFVNLQQPHFEKILHDRLVALRAAGAPVEIRGGNRVDAVEARDDRVRLTVATPDGPYRVDADWVIACDGARSPVRGMLGLGFEGRAFEDHFLIADIRMSADFPTERWFWFQPHFKSGDSALLHRQPDGIWRIDFQIGRDIDRERELEPGRVRARVAAMLGEGVDFEIVWTSIYSFQCRRMETFRHGRVLFAGDSAHQVSPFGARGANSGLQDVDNLCWKLRFVLEGRADDRLLDSYSAERVAGADENILNSTRSTDFISPATPVTRLFRDAVLDLAEHLPFARSLVNSGRLSVPCVYDGGPLNGPDQPGLPARTRPGAALPDAPTDAGWLLARLGPDFTLLAINAELPGRMSEHGVPVTCVSIDAAGNEILRDRFLGACDRAVYLIRPDRHVLARWTDFHPEAVAAALGRALALS